MSAKQIPVGPFEAVYIGSSSDTTALIRLNSIRTGGATLQYGYEEDELPVDDYNGEQADLVRLRLSITFYGYAKEIMSLAMGTWNPSYKDAASTRARYSVLFVHKRGGDNHLYLPKVRTAKSLLENFNKDKPCELPVTFLASHRNRFITPQLFYQRLMTGNSPNDLQSILGMRYPLG